VSRRGAGRGRCVPRGTIHSGHERRHDLHLGAVRLASFILKKVVPNEHEGRQWLESHQGGDRLTKLGVQVAHGVDDERWLRDRVPDVVEEIAEMLETTEILSDGEVTVEKAVVEEEPSDRHRRHVDRRCRGRAL
jgi:hypothetical protein